MCYFNIKSCKFVCRLEYRKIRKEMMKGENKSKRWSFRLWKQQWQREEKDLKRNLILMETRRSCSRLDAQKNTKVEMESCENFYKSLVPERKRKWRHQRAIGIPPFSTIVCKEAETCAEGNVRRRRSKEEKRGKGDIECHPEIAEVNFDGRPTQRGGLARRALSRAHEANRKAANEDKAREAIPREKDGPKRYRSFRRFSRGWRGKMAGAGDWGRSMNLRGKAWGGGC